MNSVILTGSNRGLGLELFKIINKSKNFSEKLFLSRSKCLNFQKKDKIVYFDFNNPNTKIKKINLQNNIKNIVFINNAATIMPIVPSKKIKLNDLNKSLNINFITPFFIIQDVLKKISNTKKKLLIINITSKAAELKVKSWLAYSISKKSLKTSLDYLAFENKNINVIHYNPGVMDTKMQKQIRDKTSLHMPDVNIYKNLKKNDKLNDPKKIAEKIYKKILKNLK